MSHVLMIPPAGVLEVWHSSKDIDARSWLEAHGSGTYTALNIVVGDWAHSRVEFMVDDDAVPNPRAREVLARHTGVHVVLTGNVAFTGLTTDAVMQVVAETE